MATPIPQPPKARILVADDDTGVRRMLARALARQGWDTTCCADGDEARALLSRHRFDCVVTDLQMPGCSGREVLRSALRQHPGLPVILISAENDVEVAVAALREGARDYLVKPFELAVLLDRIRRALAGRGPGGGDEARETVVAASPAMQRILSQAENVADSRATVLLVGESGTGKERVARFLHAASQRKSGPFVAVNCAAIPESLLESELFGHEKGSFSGADRRHVGKFEAASGGTLLLDEIGDMALPLQAKLLRVLQEFEVDRVGGSKPVPVDVRVVCTTNRDLRELVDRGTFREDLYYRIHVFPLRLSPLRERPEDVPELARHFLARSAEANRRPVTGLTDHALDALLCHSWPGNVRELENTMERAVLLCRGRQVDVGHLLTSGGRPLGARTATPRPRLTHGDGAEAIHFAPGTSLAEMERRLILKTLEVTGGNRTHTSRMLGISIRTLRNRLREYRQAGLSVAPPMVGVR